MANKIDRNANTPERMRRNFQRLADAAVTLDRVVTGEVPTGMIDSSNVTFTLAKTPIAGTVQVFLQGLRKKLTTDYTVSGKTITFVTAPTTGNVLLVDYIQ